MPVDRPRATQTPPAASGQSRSWAQARKRKRVSVACRSCRTRKSRCDGCQPCSSCDDMGTDCLYEQPSDKPVISRSTEGSEVERVHILFDQRLQGIEQNLRSLITQKKDRQIPVDNAMASPNGDVDHDSPDVTRPFQQEDGVDGVGSVLLKDGADEDEYFGMSSNVAFLRFIIHAMGHSVPPTDKPAHLTLDASDRGDQANTENLNAFLSEPPGQDYRGATNQNARVDPFALPRHAEAETMLQLYFTTVNLMVPCVHEDSFRDTQKKMMSEGVRSMRRSWLGLMNIMFAIASNIMTATSPNHERAARSRTYYERAIELVRWDVLGRLSVEMVQLFLLIETYLEGTTSSSLAWTFHSLAVKGAYQLGLHYMGSKSLSDFDREMRRRLWYSCAINDRLLSATYGRPPLIPVSYVRPEPSSLLPFSNVSSAVNTSSLAHFDAIMSITHIMGDAVEQLYDQNLGIRTWLPMSEALEHMSRLCWKLAQWQDSLPSSLKILTSQDTVEDVPITHGTTRLRVLLSLRYLGAKVLVLRPALSEILDFPGTAVPNTHQSEWLQKSGAVLLEDLICTCRDILRISENILIGSRKDQNLLGAWWFSCYYTFNSSLAILGVLLIKRSPARAKELSTSSITELRSLLDTAMGVLQGLDRGNKTILRCRDTLSRLLAAFDFDAASSASLTQAAFPLSPSSMWAWQLFDPGLFTSEASLSPAPGSFDTTRSPYLQPTDNLGL